MLKPPRRARKSALGATLVLGVTLTMGFGLGSILGRGPIDPCTQDRCIGSPPALKTGLGCRHHIC